MLRRFPALVSQHEWGQAFLSRGAAAATALIGFVIEGQLGSGPGSVDVWWLAQQVAGLAQRHPELKIEALRLYESASWGTGQRLLECVLQEIGGADGVLALVRGYARSGKPFDGSIYRVLSKAVVDEQQEPGTSLYHLHPVSAAPPAAAAHEGCRGARLCRGGDAARPAGALTRSLASAEDGGERG